MAEPNEEFEPLFDYSRVQPVDFFSLDDDSDSSPPLNPKRRKTFKTPVKVDKEGKVGKVVELIDDDEDKDKDDDDWLRPPPKIVSDASKLCENSTIKQIRLKKQELLASFAESPADVLRDVEQSAKRHFEASVHPSKEVISNKPPKVSCDRPKIVISIQDKQDVKQFRVFKDEKFERLFKMYAEKNKLDLQRLVFCFDGDKISQAATPDGLGMEDEDIIEVHLKTS